MKIRLFFLFLFFGVGLVACAPEEESIELAPLQEVVVIEGDTLQIEVTTENIFEIQFQKDGIQMAETPTGSICTGEEESDVVYVTCDGYILFSARVEDYNRLRAGTLNGDSARITTGGWPTTLQRE